MSDYESPIYVFKTQIETDIENEILKAVQNVGVIVDKEELVKAMKYDRGQYEKGYDAGLNADKWILCSERLPVIGKAVLVTVINDTQSVTMDVAYRHNVSGGGFFKKGKQIHNVVAWQPLPEPYKERGEFND